MNTFLRFVRRLAIAATAGTIAVACTALPAAAAPTPAPTDLTEVGAAQMSELANRYASLSGALITLYAEQKGLTATQFILQNPQTASALLGIPAADLSKVLSAPAETPSGAPNGTMSGAPSAGITAGPRPSSTASPTSQGQLDVLQRQLSAAGLAFASGKYASLDAYAQQLIARSSSVDAAVVASGANWAKQLGALRAPELTLPDTPNVDKSLATSMPKEGLMFGMFLDRSLTALVADSPDVFKQVQASGVGTAASQSAWMDAMMKARAGSQADFSSMLPSACGASLLAGMASGSVAQANKLSGASCSPCTTTGLYMHSQMARLFDPTAQTSLPNSNDNVINPNEWNRMQDWQRNAILKQNPSLADSLSRSLTPAGSTGNACSTGSVAASGTLATTLPGVFSSLQK